MNRPTLLPRLLCVLTLLLLTPSCSNNPTDTPGGDTSNATGQVDPGATSAFLLGTVSAGANAGLVDVWAQNLTIESAAVVSFDVVLLNKSGGPVSAPINFVITSVRPEVVAVVNADMTGPDGPVFDFSDDIGDDNVLDAGESSKPVNMKFSWPEPMAFAIGFRIDADSVSHTGFVSGIVFHDLNGNGRFDNEPGIAGVNIDLVPSQRDVLYRTHSDRSGRYAFRGLRADVYNVIAHAPSTMPPTTPNPLIVTLVEKPDGSVTGFDAAHFGFLRAPVPPSHAIFGPVTVGPGSPYGTELDSTFVVPDFFAAVNLFLVVTPPPILSPLPVHIDEASVAINGETVWKFDCVPPDSLCIPAAKVPLDINWDGNTALAEHKISIRVLGQSPPPALLMFSIVAENAVTP